jgi:hypothetical protein
LGQRPIDRFRYLESFLDLSEADRIREHLADRASVLKARADTLKQNRQTALTAISLAMPSERRPLAVTWESLERTFFSWGRQLSLISSEANGWSAVEHASASARAAVADDSSASRRGRIQSASTRLAALRAEVERLPDLVHSSQQLEQEVARTTDAGLVDLLELARAHFQHSPGARCPVCEQNIDRGAVAKSIADRLAALGNVRTLKVQRDNSADVWRQTFVRFSTELKQANIELGISSRESAPNGVALLHQTDGTKDFAAKVLAVGCDAIRTWMLSGLQSLEEQLIAQATSIPNEDKAELVLFATAVDEAAKRRVSTDLVTFLEADVERDARNLTSIVEAIRLARQDVAQQLLDEIASTVTEYYRLIHPADADAEVTGPPTIDIQRNRGGIAYLRGAFNDKAVEDPRWVYSDGHLDTVGICVFLALRRFRANQSGDSKLMILDDVVLSIDLAHARRLLEVLRDHFDDHQILIFTHNRLFASWVQSLLPSFERKTITGWTLEGGVKLGELTSASERLSKVIDASSSPNEIAQSMMTLMDEALSEARFAYQLSLPAKRDELYTLSELWEPFCKRVKEIEKALKAPLGSTQELVTKLSDLPRVRNMLAAHDNEFAREFPLTTIRELASLCLKLMSQLRCRKCSCFVEAVPNRNKPQLASCRCQGIVYVHPAIIAAANAGAERGS